MKRVIVILLAGALSIAAAAAAAAPSTLVTLSHHGTKSYSVFAGYKTKVEVYENVTVPMTDTKFGFRVLANKKDKQAYTLKWQMTCYKGQAQVTKLGVVKHRAPYTFWRPITIPGADTCSLGVLATRLKLAGNMAVSILADRSAAPPAAP